MNTATWVHITLLLLSLATFGRSVRWESVKVKYTVLFGGLYKIPLTKKEATPEFELLGKHEEFPTAEIYCYQNDPRVCPIYDSRGKIAGLRVSYIIKDLMRKKGTLPYSYDKKIFKRGEAYKQPIHYIDVLFISSESLMNGGPETRDEPVGDGVYINMDGTGYVAMPRKEADVAKTDFTEQACFVGMGKHYFYKMTPQMKCEDHMPPFLLYDQRELIGIGLIPFGSFTSTKKREWFENPPKSVVKTIVPRGPECLANWVGEYGTISLHIFFKKCTRFTCIPIIGSLYG